MKIITFKNNTYDSKKSNFEYISNIIKSSSNVKVEIITLKQVEHKSQPNVIHSYYHFKVTLFDSSKDQSFLDKKIIELGIYYDRHSNDKAILKYFAKVTKEKNKYYYCIDNTTIEINNAEYERAIGNPFLYYFSTALRLQRLIKKKKKNPDWNRNIKTRWD